MTENNSNLLIGWKQIAAYLRCASSTARRQARDKGLPVFRVGGSVRAHPADIDRWLEAQPRGKSAPGMGAAPQALIVGAGDLPTALSNLGGRAAGHRYAVIPLGAEEAEFVRIQELLRSAEEKYQRLVEQVPAWIWETNAAGEFTYSNPRSRQILGYDPGDFIGFSPTEFAVAPEDAENFERSVSAVRSRGSVMKAFRCRFVHRDGTPRWLETDAEPAFDAAGEFAGVRGVSRDVTEAVEAEAARQEAHERLTATLNALPDLLFEVDRNGFIYDFRAPDKKKLYATPEDFLGRKATEFLPSKAASVLSEALAEAAETGSHSGGQYQLDSPGGVRWFELSISSRGDHRAPECRFIILIRDITERKQAETELRAHRDKLEELVEARTAELREVNTGLQREIAERARVEKELEQHRNQLQTIITVTPDLLVLMDRDLVYRAVNPAFCNFMGKREKDLLGRTDYDIFPRPLADVYRQSDEEVLASGELHILEREAVDADGTTWWLQVAKAPIFDAKGEVSGLVVSARDISERRTAEEALRESESKYRDLFENANDLIQSVTPEGRFLYVNRAWKETLGYKDDEVPHLNLFDVIQPACREYCREVLKRVLSGERVETIDVVFLTKDGREVDLEGSASCRFEDGRPVSTRGIFRDVTKRKRAEEALRESEERYRVLFEGGNDAVFVFNLTEEGKAGPFIEVNGEACSRLGYSAEELHGLTPADIAPPENRAAVSDIIGRLAEDKEIIFEWVHVRKDGSEIPVEISSQLFEFRGKPTVVSIVRDITERKRAEGALRESEEKFRSLVERSNDGIAIVSEGLLVYTNPRIKEVAGYAAEDIIGKPFAEFIHAEERPKVTAYYERRMRGDDVPTLYETAIRRADGSKLPVEVNIGTIAYQGQTAELVFVRDLTERKKAEEARERERKAFRIIAEAAVQTTTLQELCRHVVTGLAKALGFKTGTARLYDEKTNTLQATAYYGMTPREAEQYFPDQPLEDRRYFASHVARTREPVFAPDVTRHEVAQTLRGRIEELNVRAFISWPILGAEGALLGVINLASLSPKDTAEEDRAFFETVAGMFATVLERRRAEEALRESEERYRLLADNASDVILTLGLDLRFTYVSPSVEALLDYTAEEMTALTLEKISTPASYGVAVKTLAEEVAVEAAGSRDLKRSRTVGMELIRKDGSTVCVEAKASFLRDPNDKAIGVLAVARDVTERKRAEEALRESEERLKLATEAGDLGLWDCNVVTEELIFDDRYAQQLGFDRTELEPCVEAWKELVHPEDWPWVIDVIKDHLAGKTPDYEMEYRMRTKAGDCKWILDRGKVVARDASGRALRAAGTHQDVTARREARERLRASEERYRALFELSPEAVILLDPLGTVLDVNANGYAWFGLRPQDVVGRKFEDVPLAPDDVKKKTKAAFARRLAGEEVAPYEVDLAVAGGKKWRLRVRGEILRNEKGEAVGDLVMVSRIGTGEKATG